MNQKLPASVRRATFLRVRITNAEKRALIRASKAAGFHRVSDFVRSLLPLK